MTLQSQIPDPRHPDMSPEGIDLRLRHLSQLYRLGRSLCDVKWLGPVNPVSPDTSLLANVVANEVLSR